MIIPINSANCTLFQHSSNIGRRAKQMGQKRFGYHDIMAFDEDMLGIFHGDSHFMGISPRNLGAFLVKKWDCSKDLTSFGEHDVSEDDAMG